MAGRITVCIEPGCGRLIPADTYRRRCPAHARARDAARGTRAQRGYGADHQRARAIWAARITAGEHVTCWRCGQPITNAADMHLGHDDDDRSITRGPEHALCNLSAAGRARHR